METKSLLYGIIGFILGGLLVSIAATVQDNQNKEIVRETPTSQHNTNTTTKLDSLQGDEFDRAFIEEMIGHHQGAIDMARLTDSNAKHEELKKLGQDIISAQSKEINIMQNWQKQWGYPQPTDSKNMEIMH